MSTDKNNAGKMKVLVVCHDFPPYTYSGAPLFALFLSQELIKLGIEIQFFYPKILTNKDITDQTKPYQVIERTFNNIPVFELTLLDDADDIYHSPYFRYENNFVETKFRELLEKGKYDLVHFHSVFRLSSGLPGITKQLQIPSCFTLHDFWFLCHRTLMTDYNGHTCNGPETVKKCAKCFNLGYNKSKANKILDRFEQSCNRRKVSALYNQVLKPFKNVLYTLSKRKQTKINLGFFENRIKSTKDSFSNIDFIISPSKYLLGFYNNYGYNISNILPYGLIPVKTYKLKEINPKKVVFGYAGQVIHRKGVDLFIDALEQIKGRNWIFLIYGNHQNDLYFRKLKERIEKHENILYKGPYRPEQLPDILSQFDLAVLPSRNDNYPISLLEAFSAKVPAITSDAGGFKEVIKNELNGFIFPSEKVEELIKIINKVLNKPELINELRMNIDQVKTMEENANEYYKIYLNLLKIKKTK